MFEEDAARLEKKFGVLIRERRTHMGIVDYGRRGDPALLSEDDGARSAGTGGP